MSKVLVIHGPNLKLLGQREEDIYGKTTLEEINQQLKKIAEENNVELDIQQSDHEGDIVECIGSAKDKNCDAVLINPAAYTHTSVAIRDAVLAVNIPVVEVHLSNIYSREEFRHKSLIAPVSFGQITGFGPESYYFGLKAIIQILS